MINRQDLQIAMSQVASRNNASIQTQDLTEKVFVTADIVNSG